MQTCDLEEGFCFYGVQLLQARGGEWWPSVSVTPAR